MVVSAEHRKMLKGVSDPNFHTKSNPNPDLLSLSVALRNLNETHFTWDFLPHPQCLPFVEHHEKLPSTTNPTVQIPAAEETEGETAWKTKQTVKKNPTSLKYTRYGEAEIVCGQINMKKKRVGRSGINLSVEKPKIIYVSIN